MATATSLLQLTMHTAPSVLHLVIGDLMLLVCPSKRPSPGLLQQLLEAVPLGLRGFQLRSYLGGGGGLH